MHRAITPIIIVASSRRIHGLLRIATLHQRGPLSLVVRLPHFQRYCGLNISRGHRLNLLVIIKLPIAVLLRIPNLYACLATIGTTGRPPALAIQIEFITFLSFFFHDSATCALPSSVRCAKLR